MRKATEEGTGKEKKARVRAEADPEGTSVTVEPTEAPAAEPEVPTVEVPPRSRHPSRARRLRRQT